MGALTSYSDDTFIGSATPDWETRQPEEILGWALDQWHPNIAICTSFQAAGMVILDMCSRIRPDVRVITIDTGRLPAETYEMMDQVRQRYQVQIEVLFPQAEQLETLVGKHGVNLFYDSVEKRQQCCQVRKVQPLERALKGLDAWIVGLRREQTTNRTHIQKVDTDQEHGSIMKLSPLADWTDDQVWRYMRANRVPSHPLYQQGYTSIGCAPCTRAVLAGEEQRSGRWWWEQNSNRECGLHCGTRSGSSPEVPAILSAVS